MDSHKVSFSMTGTKKCFLTYFAFFSFAHWIDFISSKFCIMGKEPRMHRFIYWHYVFGSTVSNAGADFVPSEV